MIGMIDRYGAVGLIPLFALAGLIAAFIAPFVFAKRISLAGHALSLCLFLVACLAFFFGRFVYVDGSAFGRSIDLCFLFGTLGWLVLFWSCFLQRAKFKE